MRITATTVWIVGWPLSKKLRVPFTHNCKRVVPWEITLTVSDEKITAAEFAAEYPPVERMGIEEEDFPTDTPHYVRGPRHGQPLIHYRPCDG